MKIVWSRTATDNLATLRAYIAEHDPSAAAGVSVAILEAVTALERFPSMGRPGRLPNTRELVISGFPYIIPYSLDDRTLRIITVLHTSRKWPPTRGT